MQLLRDLVSVLRTIADELSRIRSVVEQFKHRADDPRYKYTPRSYQSEK